MRTVLLPLFVLIHGWGICQEISLSENSVSSIENIDSLKSQCAAYTNIPIELELPMLLALSHFPELKESRIKFKLTRIRTTMNARPTMGTLLFHAKSKRTYVVRINNEKKDSIISIFDVPFSAQSGIFGHEFSHFADYSQMSFWGVLKRGFNYTNPTKKSAYEKETDRITIRHGLGNELFEWSDYVLNRSNATVVYKAFKRSTYLTPSEIKEEMIRLFGQ